MEFRFVPRTIHAKRAKPISTFSEYDHLLFLDECALGNLEVVNDLLARGADVNRPDKFSRTPLNQACCGGHLDVVLTLIKHGADVNSFQLWWTPLTAACFCGHLHVALALIEHGADVKKCSNKGAPPLAAACVFGHLNLVKLLVRHGADVNRPTDKGVTPLFAACKLGHLEIVKVFLQHNANTKVECYGYTPLDIAMKNGHTSIVNVLRHGLTKEDTDNRRKRTEPVNRNVRELRRNLTAPTHQSSRYISKYSEKDTTRATPTQATRLQTTSFDAVRNMKPNLDLDLHSLDDVDSVSSAVTLDEPEHRMIAKHVKVALKDVMDAQTLNG